VSDGGEAGGKPVVWRLFNSADETSEYKQRGGLELGFSSCFRSRVTAEQYATARMRDGTLLTKAPTLLKIRTDLEGLVDMSFFSVHPEVRRAARSSVRRVWWVRSALTRLPFECACTNRRASASSLRAATSSSEPSRVSRRRSKRAARGPARGTVCHSKAMRAAPRGTRPSWS
jgi:hypothetical protein